MEWAKEWEMEKDRVEEGGSVNSNQRSGALRIECECTSVCARVCAKPTLARGDYWSCRANHVK